MERIADNDTISANTMPELLETVKKLKKLPGIDPTQKDSLNKIPKISRNKLLFLIRSKINPYSNGVCEILLFNHKSNLNFYRSNKSTNNAMDNILFSAELYKKYNIAYTKPHSTSLSTFNEAIGSDIYNSPTIYQNLNKLKNLSGYHRSNIMDTLSNIYADIIKLHDNSFIIDTTSDINKTKDKTNGIKLQSTNLVNYPKRGIDELYINRLTNSSFELEEILNGLGLAMGVDNEYIDIFIGITMLRLESLIKLRQDV